MKRLLLIICMVLLASLAMANPGERVTPPEEQVAVTPSDATIYSPMLKSLYIGVAGDVRVVFARDFGTLTCATAPIHLAYPQGLFRGLIYQVCATGTAATNIIGYPENK